MTMKFTQHGLEPTPAVLLAVLMERALGDPVGTPARLWLASWAGAAPVPVPIGARTAAPSRLDPQALALGTGCLQQLAQLLGRGAAALLCERLAGLLAAVLDLPLGEEEQAEYELENLKALALAQRSALQLISRAVEAADAAKGLLLDNEQGLLDVVERLADGEGPNADKARRVLQQLRLPSRGREDGVRV